MAKNDYTMKSAAELHIAIEAERAKLAQFRFDLADKKLKRTTDIGKAKRAIARMLTVLRQSEGSRRGTRPGIASAK